MKNDKKSLTPQLIKAQLRHHKHLTPYAGVAAVKILLRGLNLSDTIDSKIHLLKQRHGFRESNHLLTLIESMLVGGTRIKDIDNIHNSSGTQHLHDDQKIVAPTTAGDTLLRFNKQDIWDFQNINIECCAKVWNCSSKKQRAKETFTVDTDASLKKLYGNCYEGADFSYKGHFSYHPEYVTRAETGEVLVVENRGGNAKSGDGVAKLLERVYPTIKKSFKNIRHRGDSKYGIQDIIKMDEKYEVTFYLGYDGHKTLIKQAEALPESTWVSEELCPAKSRRPRKSSATRSKPKQWRKEKVKQRKFKDKRTIARHVSEFSYKPSWSKKSYRMIVVRSSRTTYEGEQLLFGNYDYYFIITNDVNNSAKDVTEIYYLRGNQENIFKQLKYDTGSFWMPCKTLLGNWAWMAISALAWNIKSWLCQLGFKKGLRWMWNRFCREIMLITGTVTRGGGQIKIYVNDSHRYASYLVDMINKFAKMKFT